MQGWTENLSLRVSLSLSLFSLSLSLFPRLDPFVIYVIYIHAVEFVSKNNKRERALTTSEVGH